MAWGTLNLRRAGNHDFPHTLVYEVDDCGYGAVLDLELGPSRSSPYMEAKLETPYGPASFFVVRGDQVMPVPPAHAFMEAVERGYAENLKGDELSHNLEMLRLAADASGC